MMAPNPIPVEMTGLRCMCGGEEILVEYEEVDGVPYKEGDKPYEYVCMGCGRCS